MEGPTTKRDFREKRKSEEVFPFGGSGKIFCIFELPRLDFLQFQHDFAHFQTKSDITREAKTLQWGGQHRGWGALAPSVYMLKKALKPCGLSEYPRKVGMFSCTLIPFSISASFKNRRLLSIDSPLSFLTTTLWASTPYSAENTVPKLP